MTKLGLGIDTGGTYTDSVIYDFTSEKILAKAKALTTKEDLAEGIFASLRELSRSQQGDADRTDKAGNADNAVGAVNMEEIQLVSLSTTLATNACVEGKGGRGKLVLIGYDLQLLTELRSKYGLPEVGEILFLAGGHGQQGQVLAEPNWAELEKQVRSTANDTDAYGVVEYWGIRNPEFEQEAKRRIRQWTGKPVVCGHELSMEINSLRRAATTLLNTGLIKLIDDLLSAVKAGMARMGISAPIMIVKGDGTMMSESYARERPVETLLSGPAASVVGGMKLTGCRDALILDIGGTTSDLALIRDGLTVLAEEGVDVGSWRTGTRAIRIRTIALGGDSILSFDKNNILTIGPRKAAPLSWMAEKWPRVREDLRVIREENKWHTLSLGEFFYPIAVPDRTESFSEPEQRILSVLKDGPRSVAALAEETESSIFLLQTENLERRGIIGRGALTPSDLMHITGDYQAWDAESARLAAEIMANRLNLSVKELIRMVYAGMAQKLYDMILQFLLSDQLPPRTQEFSKDSRALMDMGFENSRDDIRVRITTPLPIIGIGAPAHIFLPQVAAVLGTEAMLSEDSGVANALGAITGSIVGEETVWVKPRYDASGITGYGCHGSSAYFETEDYEEALAWARKTAGEYARQRAEAMGASHIAVEVTEDSRLFQDTEIKLLMETVITARAVGNQAIYSMR